MDIQTFEAEVLKIEKLLYRVSWSMLSNQEDCADAVQEALTRAWENRHTLRSAKAFRSWQVQILHNVCNDMLRKRHRRPQVPLDEEVLATLASEEGGVSMEETLALLSPEYRTTVVLHYLEGYKVREIAQMLDTSLSTVKTRLMRARLFLREAAGVSTDVHGGMKYEKV